MQLLEPLEHGQAIPIRIIEVEKHCVRLFNLHYVIDILDALQWLHGKSIQKQFRDVGTFFDGELIDPQDFKSVCQWLASLSLTGSLHYVE